MKLFLALICSLAITVHAKAQSEKSDIQKLKFGISAGLNLMQSPAVSYINLAPAFKNYAKSHYAIGAAAKLTMEYISSPHLSLQPEVGFAYYHPRQVYNVSPTNSPDEDGQTDNIHVTAITLGNMFKYRTKYFSIFTGPQVDFAVSAKTKAHRRMHGSIGVVEDDVTIDLKKEGKLVVPSFNWIFGLGHNFTDRIAVQATYQLGLSKYANAHVNWKIDKISGFYTGVTYRF